MSTTISNTLPPVTTPVTATVPKSTTVSPTSDSGLAQTAVNLSSDVAIIGTLAGLVAGPDAVSLLDFLETKAPIAAPASAPSPAPTDQVSNVATDTSSNWAAALKQNPAMAYTMAAGNFTQGVANRLNAFI